jgi:hypothetical protein
MLCRWGKFRAFCFIARNEIYLKKIKSNKIKEFILRKKIKPLMIFYDENFGASLSWNLYNNILILYV